MYVDRACVRVGGSLGGKQGQLGEQEPGSCHSLECGERRDTLSDSFGLSPFFLACIPLGPPSTSPLKSKDPENQEGIQTEGGGARAWNLGESRAHPPSASPGLSRWHTPSPALSHTTPGHGESCGEGAS